MINKSMTYPVLPKSTTISRPTPNREAELDELNPDPKVTFDDSPNIITETQLQPPLTESENEPETADTFDTSESDEPDYEAKYDEDHILQIPPMTCHSKRGNCLLFLKLSPKTKPTRNIFPLIRRNQNRNHQFDVVHEFHVLLTEDHSSILLL